MDQRREPPQATGLLKLLYIAAGLFFVGMAYLGAILPGLPVTPFLLLASYFFMRSSPRLHRWLHRSPFFGRLIRDWEEHRGIRKPVKVFAVCMVVVVVSCSIAFSGLPVWVKAVIGGMALVGVTTILLLPTIRDAGPGGPAD